MSHSCFLDSAFTVIANRLLTFAVNLHRRKFPANVRVHIASVLFLTTSQYQQHLSFRDIQQKSLSVQCTFHHRLVLARFVRASTPSPFSSIELTAATTLWTDWHVDLVT